jgi:aspartate/methionine/tyrosine aminotransferase
MGWRVGWAVALPSDGADPKGPRRLISRRPRPAAGVAALALPESYYEKQRAERAAARLQRLALEASGLRSGRARGAYYDGGRRAARLARRLEVRDFLARKVGVIGVPGSSFRRGGKTRVRLNFAKKEETLRGREAAEGGGLAIWREEQTFCCDL